MVARSAQSTHRLALPARSKKGGNYLAHVEFRRVYFGSGGNQSIDVHFYSLTKRFTSATHFFLGLALAIAPVGAWIAQTGHINLAPLVLGAGVICWVAGFDLIYATQDYDFDRREGIRSLVVKLGIARSLRLAQLLHLAMFAALVVFGITAQLRLIYYGGMPLVAAALFYEHRTASKLDLAGINRAFFQSNAFVSAVFLVAVCVDRWV